MNTIHAFQCDHWIPLVVLSYTISVLGAYCALQWAVQIPQAKGWRRTGWVAGAAVAMGGGAIWSMHFIAMIACRLPVPVAYDLTLTLASLFVAIVVTGTGLYAVGRGASSVGRLLAGGVFTGLGVAAMHYTGMAAMRLPARTTYRPVLVAASVLIAIVAATAALWIVFNMRRGLAKFLSSLVMGGAVCGMHYTAMAAAVFVPTGTLAASSRSVLKSNDLGFMVFGITLLLLVLLSMGSRLIERKQIEEALRKAHEELEQQVAERTADLAKANEELRDLFDLAPDGLIVTGRDGRILQVNDRAAEMFGYEGEELVGQPVELLLPERFRQRHRAHRADYSVRPSKRSMGVGPELYGRRKDGGEFPAEISIAPLRGAEDLLVLSVVRDVSERRRMEERLREAQKMEALGTLAGGIAHEFNNLLTVIVGNAAMANESGAAGTGLPECLAEIERAAHRAAELARQMLAYSGRSRFLAGRVDLNRIVRQIKGSLESLVTTATLRLELDAAPLEIQADVSQIEQVLRALVVNASEAIGDGGGTITIRTRRLFAGRAALAEARFAPDVAESDYAALDVVDTGHGMDEATRARIFDPFFSTKFTGRGLGLAAVLGIVRGHGGAIRVESEPGRGSTFTVLLAAAGPVDRAVVSEAPAT